MKSKFPNTETRNEMHSIRLKPHNPLFPKQLSPGLCLCVYLCLFFPPIRVSFFNWGQRALWLLMHLVCSPGHLVTALPNAPLRFPVCGMRRLGKAHAMSVALWALLSGVGCAKGGPGFLYRNWDRQLGICLLAHLPTPRKIPKYFRG